MPDRTKNNNRVGLLVTCLVDLFRPNVGFAAVKLIEQAGFEVDVPSAQTCCGQPAYNSGDAKSAAAVARHVIRTFENYDYVVAPSGSCIGMIKEHYPRLFESDFDLKTKAEDLAQRTYELTTFLVQVCKLKVNTTFNATVTYHDSCAGLRELGVKNQPRMLLSQVEGLKLNEMEDSEVCCGFGGTFCVKYPDISERMVSEKTNNIKKAKADFILGGDLGCLLNIAGRIKRESGETQVFHVAEVLAGMVTIPAIGEKSE
ncbi:MAG: (Fe-S)-binding protein [Arenicellales bacterium]|nr:(Fe-S)-binding protein [Arenicellales bacterium]